MGLIGDVIGWIGDKLFGKSSSGGGSSARHVYNYEPDRVRAAEIERETKLALADKEAERIELMRDAQIELLKAQAISQAAIEKARVEGMKEMAAQLVELQGKILEVAQKRIEIIEKCSLPIIREIETFYGEVGEKILANGDEYNAKKLPQLLQILNQYEKGSPAFEIYFAQINEDRLRQGKFIEQQLQHVSERQNIVLQSFLASKDKILEQTGQITQIMADRFLERRADVLSPQQDLKALPSGK